MAQRELFYCCKTGNLSRLRYLVEEKDVDLSIRDKWEGTPLYYACLCGHYETVLFLLQNGVSCDANTFDGERCLYAALTDSIRDLLRNFKVITAVTMNRDRYTEFLRRAYETSEYSDVEFIIKNEKVLAHRSIMSSRSVCFKNHFLTSWKDKTPVDISYLNVSPGIFKNLLQYLYMGQVSVNKNDATAFIFIANHFDLLYLISEVKRIQSSKKKSSVIYLNPEIQPQQDYLKLYLSCLPTKLRTEVEFEEIKFSDLKIKVKECIFSCHKVFICERCKYLQALVTDHFSETFVSSDDEIQVITLHDLEPEVFSKILKYIYTDTVDLTPEIVLTVLSYADLFMLSGLKKMCSSFVQDILTIDDVIPITKIARLYGLSHLEDRCAEFIAKNIEMVITRSDFKELVVNDAKEIKNRQEIDTIPIIDDIRFHISSSFQVNEGFTKHVLINELLDSLNLEA